MMLKEVIVLATYQGKKVEGSASKKVRITMAVMFFIQVVLTTFPFMQGMISNELSGSISAFGMLVHPGVEYTSEGIKLAVFGGIFVLFPMVSFFFCILDKFSNAKNFISAACCVICVVMIVFGIGPQYIAIGAVISILLYLLILFFAAQGFQANIVKNN